MTDVKSNMRNKYKNVMCVACEKNNAMVEETQEHIYNCKFLTVNDDRNIKSEFYYIFTQKVEKMKEIATLFQRNMKEREKYI